MNLPLTLALEADLEQVQHAFYSAGWLVFAIGAGITTIGSLLGILFMTLVVSPNVTQRISGALRERNIRSFFVGLPVVAVFAVIGKIGQGAPVVGALGAVALGVMLVLAFAGAAEDIGRRLYWACGKEGTRASHLASGWIVFAFGSLFPVLGWFVIFPYVAISGLGSLLVGAFSGPKPVKEIEFPKE